MSTGEGVSYVVGDATVPVGGGPVVVAHVCNDIGAWGRGFVLAVGARWPEAKTAYRSWYGEGRNSGFRLGEIQVVPVQRVGRLVWVANMIAQHGTRSRMNPRPIDYLALDDCLGKLATECSKLGASAHMPRIGTGLAGGSWKSVERSIQRNLVDAGVEVVVYDLSGT